MALLKQAAFTRFVQQQKTWIAMQPEVLRAGYRRDADEMFRILHGTGGLAFHTAETFDDLFVLPLGTVCVDLSSTVWVRAQHPSDPGLRGWWEVLRVSLRNGGRSTLVFDDTIALARMYGPLAAGLALVVEGNVRELLRRWS